MLMKEFDVILGVNLLESYRAVIDCYMITISIELLDGELMVIGRTKGNAFTES